MHKIANAWNYVMRTSAGRSTFSVLPILLRPDVDGKFNFFDQNIRVLQFAEKIVFRVSKNIWRRKMFLIADNSKIEFSEFETLNGAATIVIQSTHKMQYWLCIRLLPQYIYRMEAISLQTNILVPPPLLLLPIPPQQIQTLYPNACLNRLKSNVVY